MDFAAMKRRELQALCKRHGLAAGGTNAALVARLTATLSGYGGAAEEAVGVVVGKGCLKRSPAGASGGDLDAAKKVTFELEEDEEAEVGVTGRGRRRSQVLTSPAVAKTRGRQKAGEAPPAAKGMRRRTRSQAGGGDSADESDSGEAGAGAPGRRSGRNAVNLGAADGAERVPGAVTRKNSDKAEHEEVDAVGRKHQLKRKTRENDMEDVDVGGQVGVSRRSTRSSGLLSGPEAFSSPVEKKRGRRKAADMKEKTCVDEQPAEALQSGRTLRSGVVLVAPVPPIVSESKKSRGKVQEEEPAVEKVAKAEISIRTTRSSSVAPVPLPPIVSESKKSRGKVQEEEPAVEKVDKAEISGRTTRSSSVAPVPPTIPESKKSRGKVQEEEPAVEKVVVKAEISGRTTRSSSVAPAVASPRVIAKKRGRKTDDVQLDGALDEQMENKRESSRLTTRCSIHHLASSGDEASLEQVAAPSKELPLRRSRRNPSEANMMLNSSTTSESSNCSRAPTEFNGRKIPRPTMLNAAKDGVEDGVEKPDRHLELKKSKLRNVSATVARNSGEIPFSESSGKASATDMQIKVPEPVRRSTRKSVVPTFLEHETNGMHEDVEKKQTVTKPVGRSTRRSVAPVILEKESKGLTKELVPEAHVKRPTRKSVVPAMLEKGRKCIIAEIIPEAHVKRPMRKPALPMVNRENNDHCVVVNSENLQSDKCEEFEKQPTVKQPVKRLTRKSAAPALLEIDRKGVPDILNNENGDHTEMQSDKVGHLEKQLVLKEPVRGSTGKSVVPDVNERKGLHEEFKLEVSVRTPVCKSVVPNVVNKDNTDHDEFVKREQLSVKTRSAHTSLQVALQNDESLPRTTRKSSKLAISPSQSRPTASKGRPAKRRRTSSLQEDMPAEEQKEDQIAYEVRTNDVIEVATSTALEIGLLPFTAEKSDLQDSQLNSELEGIVVVESGTVRDEDDRDILEIEMDGTVGTTEKPPSILPIPDCKDVGTISEEVVRSIENDAGRCSPDFGQSPTGPQFLFSQGIAEKSVTHNAIPCPENCVEESDVHKVKCQVETVVPSKFESYHGSDGNSVRVEESGGCTFSSQQNNEQEGSSVFSCSKDLVASAQLNLSEDVDHVLRDVITEDLVCKEEEKKDFIPSSDINVPHQISHANEPAENASGVSGAVICISQSTPISDEVNSDSSQLESQDASDNCIASSNTEAVQQDNKEEHNLHNGVTPGIHVSVMSEAAQVDVSKSEKMLLPDIKTSAFRDAQLNSEQKGNKFEEHRFSCGKDGSGKNNMSQLVNEYVMDSCQDQELKLPHDLSAFKSPKGSTTCQDEFVVGSGIGPNIVSNIATDAPGTAKQGDNLSPSETASLRNRENTPPCKIDAPELTSDHLFPMDSSAWAVQSLSGRLRETGLAVGNSDNKLCMEQVQQDDVQVLEGTLENTAQGSATLESNQQCGLSEEAEPHSLTKGSSSVEQSQFVHQSLLPQDDVHEQDGTQEKAAPGSVTPECKQKCGLPDEEDQHPLNNERCSTSVEQSPFGLQLLFSQERIEEPSENIALAVHAKNGVDESKDIHVGYGVEKTPVPESVSDHDSSVDFSAFSKSEDCAYTCDQGNEYEGLTKSCHEQEQMTCQPNLLEAANCMKDFTNSDEVSDDENNKPVHSTDISSSYEKIDTNRPVKHASVLGNGLLSSSPIASADDTDVHPSSNHYQFESTDILDELKGWSSTEALQQGLKEQCEAPKESQVTYRAYPSDMIEASTAKDLESEVPPLPSEETSDMLLEYLSLGESSKGSDIHGDFVLPSAENGDEQLIAPLLAAETSALLDEQAIPELEVGESEKCNYSSEDTRGKIGAGYVKNTIVHLHEDLHMDPIQGKELPNDLPTPKSPEQPTAGQDAETSALPDDQPNPESEKCNFSSEDTGGKNGTGYVKNTLFQYPIQGKELPNDLPAPKSPELSTAGQDEETSSLPDDQPNPESEKCNFSSDNTDGKNGTGYVKNSLFQYPIQGKELPDDLPTPKSPELSTAGQDAKTLALPDEQPKPELKGGELKEHNISSEDTSGNLFQSHEDSHMYPTQGKELLDNLPAPKSPEQSIAGQDAETSASPDELRNPELDSSEFEERNLSSEDTTSIVDTGYGMTNLFQWHEDSHMDPNQGKELPDNVPASKSPAQSTSGRDAETSAWSDEQLNPKLEAGEFGEHNFRSEDTSGQDAETLAWSDEQVNPKLDAGEFGERNFSSEDMHEYSHMDPIQGKDLPNYVPADKSPKQSTIGYGDNALGAETSLLPDDEKFDPKLEDEFNDEQVNPKLDAGEFGEHNFSSEDMHEYSHMDPIQGKVLPNYVPADKSPKQSTIGYGDNALGADDEKFDPKLEDEFNDEHNDDQTTAAMLSSGMTKPTLIEGSGSGMALPSAGGTPASTDEQPNSKLEGNEEHSRCFDADNSYISDTGLMENDNLSSLPEDFYMETFFGHELPLGTPAAKSSGESVLFRDNNVPGSVGTCQTSGRRRIEEISTKLLSFKISSAVKGSYIAMESAKTKQGYNPRPISLLRDMENVAAANPDHPAEFNTDLLDVKDSPRQGTPDGL